MLFRGFDDQFWVPHSRNTTVDRSDVEAVPALKILASSRRGGHLRHQDRQGPPNLHHGPLGV